LFDEADLLPISGLQHLAFCERQWALIHLEGIWAENRLTVEGHHLHDRAHEQETESRGDLRIARGLRLRSLRLGLTGVADVVEFHHCSESPIGTDLQSEVKASGVTLPGIPGTWSPLPVEYKRGRPKSGPYDEVQLCAQALCLEEMLGVAIPAGAFYYGQPRHRFKVAFTPALRDRTEALASRAHLLTRVGNTPAARYEKKCERCSLLQLCMPKILGKPQRVGNYLTGAMAEVEKANEGT